MIGTAFLTDARAATPGCHQASHRSRGERRIVSLAFVLFWLMIFEGAIRKWIFPEFHQLIIFIRDPIAAAVYVLAISQRRMAHPRLFVTSLGVIALLLLVAVVQLALASAPLLAIGYGIRNYLYFIPLAFVIGTYFTRDDFRRLLRQILVMSVPLALLALVQFASSPSAAINRGLGDGQVFIVVNDIVRTYGTFTFTSGQSLYVGLLMVALCCAIAERVGGGRFGRLLMPAAILATAATLFTSGSRSAIIMASIVLVAFAFAQAFTGGAGRGSLSGRLAPFVLAAVLSIAAVFLFDRGVAALAERQAVAVAGEGSTFQRAIGDLTGFVDRLGSAEPLGAGIGVGTGGGAVIVVGQQVFTLGENELARNILELGPVFGLIFVLFRFLLVGFIAVRSLAALVRRRDPVPFVIGSLAATIILSQPFTYQNTTNYFAWMLLGLFLAVVRTPAVRT